MGGAPGELAACMVVSVWVWVGGWVCVGVWGGGRVDVGICGWVGKWAGGGGW